MTLAESTSLALTTGDGLSRAVQVFTAATSPVVLEIFEPSQHTKVLIVTQTAISRSLVKAATNPNPDAFSNLVSVMAQIMLKSPDFTSEQKAELMHSGLSQSQNVILSELGDEGSSEEIFRTKLLSSIVVIIQTGEFSSESEANLLISSASSGVSSGLTDPTALLKAVIEALEQEMDSDAKISISTASKPLIAGAVASSTTEGATTSAIDVTISQIISALAASVDPSSIQAPDASDVSVLTQKIEAFEQSTSGSSASGGTGSSSVQNSGGGSGSTTGSTSESSSSGDSSSTSSSTGGGNAEDNDPPTIATNLKIGADQSGSNDATDNDLVVYLSWNAASDLGSGLRDYSIQIYAQASCGGNATVINSITSPNHQYTLPGNGTYSFKVISYDNESNSSTSNCSTDIAVSELIVPSALGITSTTTTANLDWSGSAASYRIYWNTTGNPTTSDNLLTSNSSDLSHDSLSYGTRYYYAIAGINAHGEESNLSSVANICMAPTTWKGTASIATSANGKAANGNRSIVRGKNGTLYAAYYGSSGGNTVQVTVSTDGGANWTTEQVDSSGFYPTLAVDASDNLHIIYGQSPNALKYRKRTAGSWSSAETITSGAYQGHYNLAVDSNGDVHVIYSDHLSQDIYYIKRTSSWQSTTQLTNMAAFQGHPAIAVDSSGGVHLAWRGWGWGGTGNNYYQIIYQKIGGSAAKLTDLASTHGTPSMVVDASDQVHIAYQVSNRIGYLKYSSGAWASAQTVATASGADQYTAPSIALNEAGIPHIAWVQYAYDSYWDDDFGKVVFANFTNGTWSAPTEVFNTSVDYPEYMYPSVLFDNLNASNQSATGISLLWYDRNTSAMKYYASSDLSFTPACSN